MIISKQTNLKPLLESKNGIHLTAYLVNRGDLTDLKSQLSTVISEAYEWLHNALPLEEQKKFIEPLETLLNDTRIFVQMKGNIGLFRNENLFRVLNIPIEVVPSCQVASSFHVKPLLRWLQGDQDFLLLGLDKEKAHLYFGNQDSFKLIDSTPFPKFFKDLEWLRKYVRSKYFERNNEQSIEAFSWLNDWLLELTKKSKPKLFLAGERFPVQAVFGNLKYKNTLKTSLTNSFSPEMAPDLCQDIRKILKDDSRKAIEKALLEFRFAEEGSRVRKNIFHISKAVVQGKVRKLIVTDELSIFGKIDPKSGDLAIHPFDLDHEDDCVLDDLAQLVLSQGGEVIIASRNEIPKGRPILAILDPDEQILEKTEDLNYRDLQESLR